MTGAKLAWLKVGVALFFLLEEVAGTFVPLILMKSKHFEEVLSVLNCFAAGVFISTGRCGLGWVPGSCLCRWPNWTAGLHPRARRIVTLLIKNGFVFVLQIRRIRAELKSAVHSSHPTVSNTHGHHQGFP